MAVTSCKSVKSASHHFLKEVKNKNIKGLVQKDASAFVQTTAKGAIKSEPHKSQLYTTVDSGKLHVALDENYVGSIESYNNVVSKFFANMFGISTDITVNGKTRCVNKNDYVKWLNNNTAHNKVSAESLDGYKDLHLLEIKTIASQGMMHDHLSSEKTRNLFEKMVKALVVNKDFEAAAKYAGKGANVNDIFWVREGYPLSLTTVKEGLVEEKAADFRAGFYLFFLFAAEKNEKVFCDFLRSLKADVTAKGQYLQFTKKIAEVNPVTNVVKSEEFRSSDDRVLTKLTLKTVTQLQIEDQITPKVDIVFNKDTSSLVKLESSAPIVVEKYSKSLERFTHRYM